MVSSEVNTSKSPKVFKIWFDFQFLFKEKDSKVLIFVEETTFIEIWEDGGLDCLLELLTYQL